MAQLSDIVRKHVDAALSEAAENKYPPEDVARTLISFAVQTWRDNRSIDDVAQELRYILENLDPDQEYTFMRP